MSLGKAQVSISQAGGLGISGKTPNTNSTLGGLTSPHYLPLFFYRVLVIEKEQEYKSMYGWVHSEVLEEALRYVQTSELKREIHTHIRERIARDIINSRSILANEIISFTKFVSGIAKYAKYSLKMYADLKK